MLPNALFLFYACGIMKTDKKGGLRINLRLRPEEATRFEAVMARIKARERGHVYESDIIRELMLLLPPLFLTDEDRQILAHGTDVPAMPDHPPVSIASRKRKKATQ